MNQDLLNRLHVRAGTADESDARLFMEAAAEIRNTSDKIDCYESELDNAVEVAYKRGATEWAKLNYPNHPIHKQSNLSPRDPEHLDPYGPGNGPLGGEDVFRLRDHPTDQQDH